MSGGGRLALAGMCVAAVVAGVLVYAGGRGSDQTAAAARASAIASGAGRTSLMSSAAIRRTSVARTPQAAPARQADPLTSAAAYLTGRLGTVGVAVYDLATHQTWTLGDMSRAQDEASVVKVEILETLLAREPAGLTSAQAGLAEQMIEDSDNDAATALWDAVGATGGIRAYGKLLGLTGTTPSPCVQCSDFPWPGWGLTTTTPLDQLTLLRQLVSARSVLNAASRRFALRLMEDVTPDQRWGVSAGVPAQATVALKNGWLPLDAAGTDWQINSIGWVSGSGRDYLLAVLTTGNPSEEYGIDTIDELSAIVWQKLAEASHS
jgi:hypothetical protein